MPEPAAADLDAYLGELDRRLQRVQLELVADNVHPLDAAPVPAAQSIPAAVQSHPSPAPLPRKLLSAIRELLDALEVATASPPSSAEELSLSAGPFDTTRAVHAFEAALAGLPGVREVRLRGYEGADRAILEVSLDHAPSGESPGEMVDSTTPRAG